MSEVQIHAGRAVLPGNLNIPENANALVLFAHGSGSSRHSPRNQFVARTLNEAGLATLLFDLLTPGGGSNRHADSRASVQYPFAGRAPLSHATKWAKQQEETSNLGIGYFGSSTGGAAALVAAVDAPQDIGAVVSRGGRPDLAGEALPKVKAPTLLIVGGNDDIVIELNEQARDKMRCEVKLEIVPGATHLFEEPGALEKVANSQAIGFCVTSLANDEFVGCLCQTPWRFVETPCNYRHSCFVILLVRHHTSPKTFRSPDPSSKAFQLHDLAVIDKQIHVRAIIFDVPREHLGIGGFEHQFFHAESRR